MATQAVCTFMLLVSLLGFGFTNLLTTSDLKERPKVPLQLLRYCMIALQVTAVLVLLAFIREALRTSRPWAGYVNLRPEWYITMDGLMVCVPMILVILLDSTDWYGRVLTQQSTTPMMEPIVLTVVDHRSPAP
jgi:hypothetical protein